MSAAFIGLRTGRPYPFTQLDEFGDDGETLELQGQLHRAARIRTGRTVYERFADFWHLEVDCAHCTLGEGHTPLIKAPASVKAYTGLDRLFLKNETANPTWSFKDRGTVACCALARQLGEHYLATVSTGNMGQSVAAYAARCGLQAVIIVPATAAPEKLLSAALYGAKILRVKTPDLGLLKRHLAALARALKLRITSGANPIRVEGYKFASFELLEQLEGMIPDFVAVATSAAGHIRGLHKGWRELEQAGIIETLPRMILIQAAANAPLADAILADLSDPIPYPPPQTLASALTNNAPPGGTDVLELAKRYQWLAEVVTEDEIREGWQIALRAGLWLEPSSALVLPALRNLARRRVLSRDAPVVAMLTGAGPKDTNIVSAGATLPEYITLQQLEKKLLAALGLA
ncbi:MAG: pyridoxal-phosphate dependent enzyme [Candidatus Sumerlaeaceae bacterium]|jgi:threonine synthase